MFEYKSHFININIIYTNNYILELYSNCTILTFIPIILFYCASILNLKWKCGDWIEKKSIESIVSSTMMPSNNDNIII